MHPQQAAAVDWVKDSPVVKLRIQVDHQLAAREIPVTCDHAAAAGHVLSLPSRTMVCLACYTALQPKPDTEAGPCATCESPDGCILAGWTRQEPPIVGVAVRICEECAKGQRVLQTWS